MKVTPVRTPPTRASQARAGEDGQNNKEGKRKKRAKDSRAHAAIPTQHISGHVRTADGKPFAEHPWVNVVSEDGSYCDLAYVDDEGRFEARGLEPGRYVVGVDINAQPNTAEWRARVYYPGVRSKDDAIVVELGTAERRTNVDFRVPQPRAP